MGRKATFIKEEALQKALDVFWKKGYLATSVRDIAEATQLQLASLYHAFGNKDALFSKVLETYLTHFISPKLSELSESKTPLATLKEFFSQVQNKVCDASSGDKGCFVINTVIELAGPEPKLAAQAMQGLKNIEDTFTRVLRRAQEQGEWPQDRDAYKTARYLVQVLITLRLMARLNRSAQEIEDYMSVAFAQFLPESPRTTKPQLASVR